MGDVKEKAISLDSSDFVSISEVIPQVLLDIRYYSTYNFIGERIDGYLQPIALLTKEAAASLKDAAGDFEKMGYRIKVFDAYRPQKAVDHFVRWAGNPEDVRMKDVFYPEISKDKLFPLGFIAEHSGHSRGSTVDITLFDVAKGQDVDMGGNFDYFGDLSHSDYADITDTQRRRRLLLKDTMIKNGFEPLKEEWWHFTLKDEPFPETYFDFDVSMESKDVDRGPCRV